MSEPGYHDTLGVLCSSCCAAISPARSAKANACSDLAAEPDPLAGHELLHAVAQLGLAAQEMGGVQVGGADQYHAREPRVRNNEADDGRRGQPGRDASDVA
jgi:hypothetical protein